MIDSAMIADSPKAVGLDSTKVEELLNRAGQSCTESC